MIFQGERMELAVPEIYFFDLDHTLADNDCDVSWKQFLVKEGIAPPGTMREARRFFDLYVKGELDSEVFMDFQLREIAGKSVEDIAELSRRHFAEFVEPKIYDDARREVEKTLDTGKPVVLLTGSNQAVSGLAAEYFGFSGIIATKPEVVDGKYTGKITDEYCAGEGKVIRSKQLCGKLGLELNRAAYYGDSLSDRNMLAAAGFPVVVNPSEQLLPIAKANNWPIRKFC